MKGLSIRLPFSLIRDERGASIVELALFAPFLGTLLLGLTDLGRALSARHELQRAADQAMELAMSRVVTADAGGGEVDYSFLRRAAAEAADVPLANVTLTMWRECNGVKQNVYNQVCPSITEGGQQVAQEVARYVRIRVTSSYVPVFRYGPVALSSAAIVTVPSASAAEAAVRVQ